MLLSEDVVSWLPHNFYYNSMQSTSLQHGDWLVLLESDEEHFHCFCLALTTKAFITWSDFG